MRFSVLVTYDKKNEKCNILAKGDYNVLSDFQDTAKNWLDSDTEHMLMEITEQEYGEIAEDIDKITARFKSSFAEFADFSDMMFDSY